MKSLAKEKRNDIIGVFKYPDDLFNIKIVHFEQKVHRIYQAELQLSEANASDTKAAFLDYFIVVLPWTPI